METPRIDTDIDRGARAAPWTRGPCIVSPFVSVRRGGLRLCVARPYEAAIRARGLDDAAHLRALVRSLEPDASRRAGRATTCVIETSAGPVFVKRALKGGALAPLFAGRVPRFKRVTHEIGATEQLRTLGAPVLEPVFAAGVREGAGWLAVVGTGLVEHAVDGATAIERAIDEGDDRVAALARRLGDAIRRFHDAGGRHADLAITNLLVPEATDATVRVVDLQGARVGAPPSPARRRRELARLERSIAVRPAIRPALDVAWPALRSAYESG